MNLYGKDYHTIVTWPPDSKLTGIERIYRNVRSSYIKKLRTTQLSILSQEINGCHPKTVLEVGAGDGHFLNCLSSLFPRGISFQGIDLPMSYGVIKMPGKVLPMNAMDLQYPAFSFDFLYSIHVLEHVANPEQVYKEITRVLRQQGRFIIFYPIEAFRGSRALLESIFISKSILGGLRLAKKLHINTIRAPHKIVTSEGCLRLIKRRWLLTHCLCVDRVLVYEKE